MMSSSISICGFSRNGYGLMLLQEDTVEREAWENSRAAAETVLIGLGVLIVDSHRTAKAVSLLHKRFEHGK